MKRIFSTHKAPLNLSVYQINSKFKKFGNACFSLDNNGMSCHAKNNSIEQPIEGRKVTHDWTKWLQFVEHLFYAEIWDVLSNGHLDKYQTCKISPNTNTPDLHLSLQALAGSGHGQVSDKSGGHGCILEIWEMPKALEKRKLDLSCCRDLSLQFPIPPTDRSRDCVNSSAPWNDC